MGKINSKHHYIDNLNTSFNNINKHYHVPNLYNEFETYKDYIDMLLSILLSDNDFREISNDLPLPISLNTIDTDHDLYNININVYYTSINKNKNKNKIQPICVRNLVDLFDYPKNIMIIFNEYNISLNIQNNIMMDTLLHKNVKV